MYSPNPLSQFWSGRQTINLTSDVYIIHDRIALSQRIDFVSFYLLNKYFENVVFVSYAYLHEKIN